jgi:ribosomal-protein-alanine N-acetyltransferase
MKIRFVTRADIKEIVEIEQYCFEFPWGMQDFLEELRQPESVGIVASDDGCVLGYAFYQRLEDQLQIVNVAVHPDDKRKGIGKTLVDWICGQLAKRQRRVTAIVRESNISALKFFKSNEFKAIQVLKKPFGEYDDDGYLMSFEKNKVAINLKNRVSEASNA